MTKEVTTRSSEPSLPKEIKVISNKDQSKSQSLVGGLVSIAYFESLINDGVSARVTFNDTGTSKGGDLKESIVEGLPIVGQEQVVLKFEDNNEVKIGDKPELILYVFIGFSIMIFLSFCRSTMPKGTWISTLLEVNKSE